MEGWNSAVLEATIVGGSDWRQGTKNNPGEH